MFRRLLEGLTHRIPSQCAVCHAWPRQVLCSDCVNSFAQPVPRCHTCALPAPHGTYQCGSCITRPPPLDCALAAVPYAYPWARLVQAFKFHEHTAWARSMAELMHSTPWVEPTLEAADWLIPLPLSRERLRERGFNQALLLARALHKSKTRADMLLRIRHTPAQRGLPREARIHNMQGAFAPEPRHYHQIQGKNVVIVDDVMTTGASLHAAATALRAAGAARITALVFARAE